MKVIIIKKERGRKKMKKIKFLLAVMLCTLVVAPSTISAEEDEVTEYPIQEINVQEVNNNSSIAPMYVPDKPSGYVSIIEYEWHGYAWTTTINVPNIGKCRGTLYYQRNKYGGYVYAGTVVAI